MEQTGLRRELDLYPVEPKKTIVNSERNKSAPAERSTPPPSEKKKASKLPRIAVNTNPKHFTNKYVKGGKGGTSKYEQPVPTIKKDDCRKSQELRHSQIPSKDVLLKRQDPNRIVPGKNTIQRLQIVKVHPDFSEVPRTLNINAAKPIPTLGSIYRRNERSNRINEWYRESIEDYLQAPANSFVHSGDTIVQAECVEDDFSKNLRNIENQLANRDTSEAMPVANSQYERDNKRLSRPSLSTRLRDQISKESETANVGDFNVVNTLSSSNSVKTLDLKSTVMEMSTAHKELLKKSWVKKKKLFAEFTIGLNSQVDTNDRFETDNHHETDGKLEANEQPETKNHHKTDDQPKMDDKIEEDFCKSSQCTCEIQNDASNSTRTVASYVFCPSEVLQKVTNMETADAYLSQHTLSLDVTDLESRDDLSQCTLEHPDDFMDDSRYNNTQGSCILSPVRVSHTSLQPEAWRHPYYDYQGITVPLTQEGSNSGSRNTTYVVTNPKKSIKSDRLRNHRRGLTEAKGDKLRRIQKICRLRWNSMWNKTTARLSRCRWSNPSRYYCRPNPRFKRFRTVLAFQQSIVNEDAAAQTVPYIFKNIVTHSASKRDQRSAAVITSLRLLSLLSNIARTDETQTSIRNINGASVSPQCLRKDLNSLSVSKREKTIKPLIKYRSDPSPRKSWNGSSISNMKSFKIIKWETRDGNTSWSYVAEKKRRRNPDKHKTLTEIAIGSDTQVTFTKYHATAEKGIHTEAIKGVDIEVSTGSSIFQMKKDVGLVTASTQYEVDFIKTSNQNISEVKNPFNNNRGIQDINIKPSNKIEITETSNPDAGRNKVSNGSSLVTKESGFDIDAIITDFVKITTHSRKQKVRIKLQ
ncbi:uncharacterized protein LOC113236950 [Hyposmocoma kahamanoa]|uniref:uncharacterized protein LOC113236950 n=1 Tax=Hyposmocoma kahamanoa TaxID=1477025 RepID=UPI000E6D7F29|nr:uncharacterized protein LOC113236950 [Hyposmocoma kahamanoa]